MTAQALLARLRQLAAAALQAQGLRAVGRPRFHADPHEDCDCIELDRRVEMAIVALVGALSPTVVLALVEVAAAAERALPRCSLCNGSGRWVGTMTEIPAEAMTDGETVSAYLRSHPEESHEGPCPNCGALVAALAALGAAGAPR